MSTNRRVAHWPCLRVLCRLRLLKLILGGPPSCSVPCSRASASSICLRRSSSARFFASTCGDLNVNLRGSVFTFRNIEGMRGAFIRSKGTEIKSNCRETSDPTNAALNLRQHLFNGGHRLVKVNHLSNHPVNNGVRA